MISPIVTKGIAFRKEALRMIDAAATLLGINRSQFVQDASVAKARQVLDAQPAMAEAIPDEARVP